MSLEGDFDHLSKIQAKMEEISSSDWRFELSQHIAIEYETYVAGCFRAGTSPYGVPWAPLGMRVSINGRGQKPLRDTSIMSQAIETRNITESGFEVVVNHPGAKVHQYGATIVAKNAPYLCFRGVAYKQVNVGKKNQHAKRSYSFVQVKQVTIPARPYLPLDGIPPQLEADMIEAADEFIEETLDV